MTVRKDGSIKFSVQNFMSHKTGQSIDEQYILGKVLGEGAFGEVFLGTNVHTKEERAVKKMEKDPRDPYITEEILHEFAVLKELDHPNVLKVYDLFEDTADFYIVTDLYGGGDLFDYLDELGNLPEQEVKIFMNKMLSCIKYLHDSCHMVHRDLKLENILLDDNKNVRDMKLIDFGLAQSYNPDRPETMTFDALCGSTSYIAPQVVEGEYTSKCDMWSCGVIAFCLLAGYTPFDAPDDGQVIQAILVGKFDFDDEMWDPISDEAKDFICNLLAYEEEERPTAEQALTHPWLQKLRKRELKESDKERKTSILESLTALRKFSSKGCKLKQATCAILASQLLKKHEKDAFNDGFLFMNPGMSGSITKDDLQQIFKDVAGVANKDSVDTIFEQVNFSGSGGITYSEYAVAMMFERKMVKDKLQLAFDMLDVDSDGKISAVDLQGALNLDKDTCYGLIEPYISDGSDVLSFDDFRNAIMPKPGEMDGSVANLMDELSRMDNSCSNKSTSTRGSLNETPSIEVVPTKDAGDMTIAKKQECFMWYARFGQPSRDKFVRKVTMLARRGDTDCKITPEEVQALPWIYGGALLPIKEMNRINEMKPEEAPTLKKAEVASDTDESSSSDSDSSSSSSGSDEEDSIAAPPPRITAKPALKAIPRPGAKKTPLKLSTVLSGGSDQSLTTETIMNPHSSGSPQVLLRTRSGHKRAVVSIFSSKQKPEADWISLGNTRLMIASFEERQKSKPAYAFKSIVKPNPIGTLKAYRARMQKLEEHAKREEGERAALLKKQAEEKCAKEAKAAAYSFAIKEAERTKAEAEKVAREGQLAKAEEARVAKEIELVRVSAAAKAEDERVALEEAAAAKAEDERLAHKAAAIKAEDELLAQAASMAKAEVKEEEERLAKGVYSVAKVVEEKRLAREAAIGRTDAKEEEELAKERAFKTKPSTRKSRTTIFTPSAMSDDSKNRQFPQNRRRSSVTTATTADKAPSNSNS